ncbi:MAG: hypothetical protein ACOYXA_12670 [Bacteroidota bacterium]
MSKLQDLIRNNREAFDNHEPSEKVWQRIAGALGQRTTWWNSVGLWRAAAVVLLGLSVFLLLRGQPLKQRAEVAKIQGEFTDVETFYKEQIAEKVALIEDLETDYEDDHFTQDLQKLDAMYQVLREQMKTQPSEKVKDALVLNMLVRIDLLNQQIKKLEDSRKKASDPVSI